MHSSSLLTIAAATLASAFPALPAGYVGIDAPGQFEVKNFVFGCSATCAWSFDVSVHPDVANHPSVPNGVKCEGNKSDDAFFKQCAPFSNGAKLFAFIGKDDNKLQLKYEVTAGSTVYDYYGEEQVYPSTSAEAAKQKPEFVVQETSGTSSPVA